MSSVAFQSYSSSSVIIQQDDDFGLSYKNSLIFLSIFFEFSAAIIIMKGEADLRMH